MHRVSKLLCRIWGPNSGPYPLLVLLFLTIFVLPPLVSARIVTPIIFQIGVALILVAGAFSVHSGKSVRLLALIVALLLVFKGKLGFLSTQSVIENMDLLLSVVLLSVFTLLMVKSFFPRERPPAHRIAGAVAVYLLLGLIWARLYQVVELLSPGAFRIPEGESLNPAVLNYFSFITLATTGYGDVIPINVVARNLSVIEAIVGQLYLVILISRLVSEASAQPRGEGGY